MGTLRLHLEGWWGLLWHKYRNKKQSLSVQDAIFLSISIICFSRISFASSSSIFFHPPWFLLLCQGCSHLLPPSPRSLASSHYLNLPLSSFPASTVSGCPSFFHHPGWLMTLLITGNEFSNVNCKGPQGKARGGAAGTESPGWSLPQGRSSGRRRHEACV